MKRLFLLLILSFAAMSCEMLDEKLDKLLDGNKENNGVVTEIPNNQIWYTSTNGEIFKPNKTFVFGANIISNTYKNGLGIFAFDSDVTKIGDYAFFKCENLTSIVIPNSAQLIQDHAFYDCSSLTSVTIPDSVTTIGGYAFGGCNSLTSITIPNSVTEIGDYAFAYCYDLTSVTIPDSVTTIGGEAFFHCENLTSVLISNSIQLIQDSAFCGCSSLTSIVIPECVTSIGSGAFNSCDSLTNITIPDSVTTIGNLAFYYCNSLTSVYCKAITPPTGGYYMFNDNASDRKIYVPMESVEAYKSASYWSEYADDIVGYDFENNEVVDTERPSSGYENGYEWIDLGLRVKWASCNVGANSPEEYGDYFAWGETSPKEEYTEATYIYCKAIEDAWGETSYEYEVLGDISETQYDAASVNWGGSWRMPTKTEMVELYDNCTWDWISLNGVAGMEITGPNGNRIFLPSAGCCRETSDYVGLLGCYWSSTPDENGHYVFCRYVDSTTLGCNWSVRYYGLSVRPVLE